MWTKFYQLLKLVAKYGKRAVDWCWSHRGTIWRWLERGFSIYWIAEEVRKAIGG